jgi:quercetin dioxygenase-like cupin family protein
MRKVILFWSPAILVLALIPFLLTTEGAGAPQSAPAPKMPQQRLTPDEFPWSNSVANLPGSGLQPGIETIYVVGDGAKREFYSMVFRIAPHTVIQPHSHPDSRSCFVLSGGPWYFAYGTVRDESKLKALPPGSSYTEPANTVHFAGTRDASVLLECTAIGPTGTTAYQPAK